MHFSAVQCSERTEELINVRRMYSSEIIFKLYYANVFENSKQHSSSKEKYPILMFTTVHAKMRIYIS